MLRTDKVRHTEQHRAQTDTLTFLRATQAVFLVKLVLVLFSDSLMSLCLCADDDSKSSLSVLDVCVTSEDKRYFVSETDDISNLETSVLESPGDTQLWIKLAFKYLNQNDV